MDITRIHPISKFNPNAHDQLIVNSLLIQYSGPISTCACVASYHQKFRFPIFSFFSLLLPTRFSLRNQESTEKRNQMYNIAGKAKKSSVLSQNPIIDRMFPF